MTKLMYLEDSYKKEFTAKISDIVESGVVLDKTYFYPTGGGQPCDLGEIAKIRVLEVKKGNGKIIHILNKPLGFKVGDEVECKIDWPRRYILMRSHTAAHLLSAIIHRETGALITGGNLGEEKCRIDFNLEDYNRNEIEGYVEECNNLIKRGAEVKAYVIPRERAKEIDSVFKLAMKLPDSITELRILEIVGIDKQADAGTHVKNIREVGEINLLKIENKGKINRRLYYKVV